MQLVNRPHFEKLWRRSLQDFSAVCNTHRISKHSMLCISYTFIASVYICRERLYTICLYCVYGFHMCLIYNRTTELYKFLVKSNKYGVWIWVFSFLTWPRRRIEFIKDDQNHKQSSTSMRSKYRSVCVPDFRDPSKQTWASRLCCSDGFSFLSASNPTFDLQSRMAYGGSSAGKLLMLCSAQSCPSGNEFVSPLLISHLQGWQIGFYSWADYEHFVEAEQRSE